MLTCAGCGSERVVYTDELRSLTHITRTHRNLCARCFSTGIENRVSEAIEQHRMIEDGDRILLCVSGEKDSTVMFHLVHQWLAASGVSATLTVLTVDEGISDYRTKCVEVVRRHAAARDVPLVLRTYAVDFGMSLDQIHVSREPDGHRMCSYCCSLRAHTLRRAVGDLDVNKIATGMNLNDAVEYALQCLMQGRFDGQSLPVYQPPGSPYTFIQPIYQIKGVECALYARLNQVEIMNEDCLYCEEHVHDDLRHSLNLLEDANPGILRSFFAGYRRLAERADADRAGAPKVAAPTVA